MPEQEGYSTNPIVEGAKEGVVEFARSSVKWILGGALVGAVVVGVVGMVLFGWTGLAIGAVAGAVGGGIGAWLFYLSI
jgi:hypothetical protein